MKNVFTPDLPDREILPHVRRPQRYAGREIHRIVKPEAPVRWALAFPDLYEIGMSWLGLQILYHRINTQVPEVAAERVFLPEEDAAARLRAREVPLYTLETRTPLRDVDAVGVDLSYEMAFPGMLELLDLGGIPVRSADRTGRDPIVIAGGAACYNPEPIADFVDAVAVGEGEDVSLEIARVLLEGRRRDWPRARVLEQLGELEGVYLPHRHPLVELPSGKLAVDLVDVEGRPLITGRTVNALRREYYPDNPLVPLTEVTFDRLSLEIMRGCTRGCRFCQAGTIYRPVRERPVEDVIDQAVAQVRSTGHDELSLMSLSTSDYARLPDLIDGLREAFRGQGISVAFPSLRPDSFTRQMARAFPGGRKAGLTFAPEAGTQRLRDVINKNSREEDLLRAATIAFEEGYNNIKLYFMIGLPGEAEADLRGIADLANKVAAVRTRKGQKVSASISPFAPKPHTPFQRVAQDTPQQLQGKLDLLREAFRGSPVRMNGHDPRSSLYESALARGDRRLGRVVERVWRTGGVLEAWNDRFDPARWAAAFEDEGLDPRTYVNEIPGDEALPWGHITKGVTDKFLEKERRRAYKASPLPDCREGTCVGCGLESFRDRETRVCNIYPSTLTSAPHPEDDVKRSGDVAVTARLRYRRGENLRWTGHLDLVRIWNRLLRRADVPIAFSQGFHPHPRVSFGPPLPVGLVSEDEYVDLDLTRMMEAAEIVDLLARFAPPGLEPLEAVMLEKRPRSLASQVEQVAYGFTVPEDEEPGLRENVQRFLASERVEVRREKGKKVRTVDIRSFVGDVRSESGGEWRIVLNVENGATARLEELAGAWGLEHGLGPQAVRHAMRVRSGDGWVRPLDAVDGILSRAQREVAA